MHEKSWQAQKRLKRVGENSILVLNLISSLYSRDLTVKKIDQ